MTSSSSSTRFCFNLNCREGSEKWRRGWPRRTGDYAQLCDRCASAYEEGKFCETFHLDASGWRSCESCGKKIHCGCIVSFHMFVLLDAGRIECLTCTKKSDILTPNPAWPPPYRFLPSQPERMKDLSVKTSSATVDSGPDPWNPTPNLFNGITIPSNVQPRMPSEIDLLGGMDRFRICQRLSTASLEKKDNSFERLVDGKSRIGPVETFVNGNAGASCKEQSNSSINDFDPTTFPKNDSAVAGSCVAATSSKTEANEATQLSPILSQPFVSSIQVGKQVYRVGSSSEVQPCTGKARGDDRCQGQLLPRYRLQITDEELQQISTDSNSVITPLFEKLLTASDAGRIGRLVLPKKCAEAYFPPIAQPEGLPLEVRDVKGKEWVFQFRFWPNNNSRMYVLEGITPCLQSLQLQTGDTVTFSRLEPDGKLIMGCRKASIMPSFDQGDEASLFGNNASVVVEDSIKNWSGEVISINGNLNGKSQQRFPPINAKSDPESAGSIVKSTFNAKKILETKPMAHNSRKNSTLCTKSKRRRIESEDIIELKLTWKEAQLLMRPPPKISPSVFVIDGFEIEEFEEAAPIIGRPTIPVVDHLGLKIQWAQCEECFKWRKVPADALLSSRGTCSENVWDLGRRHVQFTRSGLDSTLDLGKGKGKAIEEPTHVPVSAVQTMIDLSMDSVNEYIDDMMQYFDEWMNFRKNVHFRTMKKEKTLARAIGLEESVLATVQTRVIAEAMERREYMVELMRVKKLRLVLAELKTNYNPTSPTAYDDADVIYQLDSDLLIVLMRVKVMEADLKLAIPSEDKDISQDPAAAQPSSPQPTADRPACPPKEQTTSETERTSPITPASLEVPLSELFVAKSSTEEKPAKPIRKSHDPSAQHVKE